MSFGFLRESQWTIYVEVFKNPLSYVAIVHCSIVIMCFAQVPNQEYDQEGVETGNFATTRDDPDRSLQEFLEAFPVLDLLGKRHYISPEM